MPEWVLYSPLSPNAKVLYGIFALHANQDGRCHPSQQRLAELLGVSKRGMQRALSELQDSGAVSIESKLTATGRRPNTYIVQAMPIPTQPRLNLGANVTPIVPNVGANVTPVSPANVTPVSWGSDTSVATYKERELDPGNQTQKPLASVRCRDDAFEALADSTGNDLTALTPSARGRLNRALREIRSATPSLNGELAAEIRLRARRYTRAHPTWELTPSALAKWWPTFSQDRAPPVRGFESAATQVLRQIHEAGERRRDGRDGSSKAGLPAGAGLPGALD